MNPQTSMPMSGKETVDALADQWGKLMAFHMHKIGAEHVVISGADIQAFMDMKPERVIVVQELKDGLHIRLMPTEEAKRLAEENKHRGFGKS